MSRSSSSSFPLSSTLPGSSAGCKASPFVSVCSTLARSFSAMVCLIGNLIDDDLCRRLLELRLDPLLRAVGVTDELLRRPLFFSSIELRTAELSISPRLPHGLFVGKRLYGSVEGATAGVMHHSCHWRSFTSSIVLLSVNFAPFLFAQNRRAAHRATICPACH